MFVLFLFEILMVTYVAGVLSFLNTTFDVLAYPNYLLNLLSFLVFINGKY